MTKSLLVLATVFSLLIVGIATVASGQDSAETLGAIYRVEYDNSAEIEPLLQFDLWQDRITDGAINVRMTDAQLASITNRDLNITLLPEDTATLYVDEVSRGGDGIAGFECYRTVEATATDLASLAASHPTLIEVIDIGDSHDKATAGGAAGYDMLAYKVTNQATSFAQPKPIFFIIAAVHAREYVTAETATRFVEQIVNNYGIDPDMTWLLDNFELHVIPQGNPDGRKTAEVSATRTWRKNRNQLSCSSSQLFGVDLNRNVSYQWGTVGSSGSACFSETYRGPSAASEVETMAFESYANLILPDQRDDTLTASAPLTTTGMFVTIHSAIPAILPAWAWTDYDDNPNFEGLNAIGRKMARFNDYRVYGTNAGIGADAGTHDDYVYGTFGIPSFTYELGNTFFQACTTYEDTIYPDNFDALLYGFKAAYQPYTQSTGPDLTSLTAANSLISSVSNEISVVQGETITLTASADDNLYHQDSFYASNPHGVDATIAVQSVAMMTVSIDAPSWQGPTQTFGMTASDGNFDSSAETASAAINTTGWSVGKHLVYVEATDSDGITGVPTAIFVTILPSNPTRIFLPLITAAPAARTGQVGLPSIMLGHGALLLLTATLPHNRTVD